MVLQKVLENSPKIDTWVFGCLLYYLLFGVPPPSYLQAYLSVCKMNINEKVSEPSSYFHYEVLSVQMLNEIMRGDFGVSGATAGMEEVVKTGSFECMVRGLVGDDSSDQTQAVIAERQSLGALLGVIWSCLSFEAQKRPSISGILHSALLKQARYQRQTASKLVRNLVLYRSPRVSIGEEVVRVLREICGEMMRGEVEPKRIVEGVARVIERVGEAVFGVRGKKAGEEIDIPDGVIVKFVFDNDVLDLLVFAGLRYHGYFEQHRAEITETSLHSSRILIGLQQLYKFLFLELTDYHTVVAPWITRVLESFVKLYIGEEYKLGSSMINELNKEGLMEKQLKENSERTNRLSEYSEWMGKGNEKYHFFTCKLLNGSEAYDSADLGFTELKQKSISRGHMVSNLNWTPLLPTLFSPLYKDILSNKEYKVLHDYLQQCAQLHRSSEYNLQSKLQKMKEQESQCLPKTADYYSELLTLQENLLVVSQQQGKESFSRSGVLIVLRYIKSMLMSQNTEKIKVLLDGKIIMFIIPFLWWNDAELKREVLEIFEEISKGFQEEGGVGLGSEGEKRGEQISKIFGIVGHINTNSEDNIDRNRFLYFANDYQYFNQTINRRYLKQIAQVFISPNAITALFAALKTPTEPVSNKAVILQICSNLLDGHWNIIKMLRSSTADIFSQIYKILVAKKNMKEKQQAMLKPLAEQLHQKICLISKKELVKILEEAPGVKNIIRDINEPMPRKLNLNLLDCSVAELVEAFAEKEVLLKEEAKQVVLAKTMNEFRNVKSNEVQRFGVKVKGVCGLIISWFKYYYKSKIVFVQCFGRLR